MAVGVFFEVLDLIKNLIENIITPFRRITVCRKQKEKFLI